MTVAGRSPQKAFDLVVAYTRAGEDSMAARVYAESSLSLTRYMKAIARGRMLRATTPETTDPAASGRLHHLEGT